jgi:hypothetical protein
MKKIRARISGLLQVRPRDIAVELAKELEIFNGFQKRKPLASYIGWTGQGNLGDEVLLESHRLLFSDFLVVPYRPENVFQSKSQSGFKSPGFKMGFLGGGTLINQSPAWLSRIQELQRRGLPMFCLGGGVSPDEFRPKFERTSISEWVTVLKNMEFVGVRGPYSQQLLAEFGFIAPVMGDPAIALAPLMSPPPGSRNVIGINVGISNKTILLPNSNSFLPNVVQLIQSLIAEGKQVVLLPVCAEDVASNEAILSLVNSDSCKIKVSYDSLEEYNSALLECGLFIGQKLHATVLATILRIPSIMIEYQPKCRDYMASIDMENFVAKTSEFTVEWALDTLHHLEDHYYLVRLNLENQVAKFRGLQFDRAKKISQQVLADG